MHGFIAYFAGGWVRDFLMHHPSDDIDIATNASVDDIQKLFEKTIPVGVQFGIIIVVENHHHFEIATFRKDHGYEDGRRPIGIEKATPEEDAKRRDFTINGMFYDPLSNTLFDFVKGQEDLHQKVIRAIGNPHQRFIEDRLRMMRAVRYACRFHFIIEERTKEAIRTHAHSLFPSVAIERVWQEFYKMKRFGSFKLFLLLLYDMHLLQTIFEELQHLPYEELLSRLKPLDYFPQEAPVIAKLLELFPNSSLEKKLSICEKFKLSNQDKDFVRYYHSVTETLRLSLTPNHTLTPYDWVYLYAHTSFSLCLNMSISHLSQEERNQLLASHHETQKNYHSAIHRIKTKDPVVKSEHLLKAGISPGTLMGKLLKEAEKMAINEDLHDPESVIRKLKKTPLWP
jgi:poly(A) polymerase